MATDRAGRPLAGALVLLRRPGSGSALVEARTGSDGMARLGWRPPGRYVVDLHHEREGSILGRPLWVRAAAFADGACAGVATGGRAREGVERDGVPRLEVRDDAALIARFGDGRRPLAGLPVWLRAYPDGPWITTLRRTDSAGWLTVTGLAPGPVQVEVAEDGWWAAPVLLEASTRAQLERRPPQAVRLVRSGTLELRLRGLSRRALTVARHRTRLTLAARGLGGLEGWLAGHRIDASPVDGLPDRRGCLRLGGVPATKLTWRVERGGVVRAGEVTVTQHRPARLDVELARRRRCLVARRSATTRA